MNAARSGSAAREFLTGRRWRGFALLALAIALTAGLVYVEIARAAITVTPASGGTGISVDTAANAASPAYTTLGNIVVAEGANGDFTSGANQKLELQPAAGWQFNPGAGSTSFTNGKNITSASISVTASLATVTVSVSGTNKLDTLTISGLQVQPTTGAGCSANPCFSGDITRTGSGTDNFASSVGTGTNFGSLSAVPGAATKLGLSGASSSTAGQNSASITATIQDQFGNATTRGSDTVVTPSSSSTSGTKAFKTTGGATQTTFTITAGTSTVSFLYYDETAGSYTITLTNDASLTNPAAYAFTVNPAAATKLVITSVNGGSNPVATAPFDVVVRSQDPYDNFANVSAATGVSLSRETGTGTLGGTTTGTISAGASSVTVSGVTYSVAESGVSLRATRTSGDTLSDGVSATFTVDSQPTVTNVTSAKADGSYTVGEVIDVDVSFSEVVTVTGTPRLELETGATDRQASYLSGSGTSTLTFRYTVAAGDTSGDLDYTGTGALTLNGGTIRNGASVDALLTLASPGAAGSLGANKALVIDTTAPTVTDVTSAKANGSYTVGEVIDVDVSFSEAVTVTGTPQIQLETGTTDRQAAYLSGSGTGTLTFRYTVVAGDTSGDLDYTGTGALTLNGGTIRDGATNDATLTLAAPGAAGSLGANKALVVDTTAPTVTNVTSAKANGSYTVVEVIDVDVVFSEVVTVTGTPQLELETGTTDRQASYLSGSGTSTLTFRYTVAAGDTSGDLDYTGTGALTLNGGTVRDGATNNATLTLAAPGAAGSLGANKVLVVDTTAPAVTNVTSAKPDGSYGIGEVIDLDVTFSEAVTVTGTPQLELETGATNRLANYFSGSGSSTLTFRYTVAAGDESSDLDYPGSTALTLNGGTIRDAATNNATLTLAAPGAAGSLGANKALVIDAVSPTVTSVTSAKANGSYTVGEVIDVQVVLSEVVTVTGTPQLELETGATDRQAAYLSGSGTATLTFRYTVAAGDTSGDLDYTGTGALTLNGGTIRDGLSNNAVLTLAAPGAAGSLGANKALVVDTTAPAVTNVTSAKPDGSYAIGEVIDVDVSFSEAVTVTGTPQLELETGATDRQAAYLSGSGTGTLTFRYTVAAGDTSGDLDYTGTGALTLNGGTIRDGAANDATLTLAAPGAAGSLGANKALVVDGVRPTVTNVTSPAANGVYGAAQTIDVEVAFTEAVTVTGTPRLELETGATDRFANYLSGSGSATLTFRYTVVAGDQSADLDYTGTGALTLNGGTIRDAVANDATLTLAAPGAGGSLAANKDLIVDTGPPSVTNVTSAHANGAFTVGEVIDVQVVFDEAVTVTGTPTLELETGSVDRAANYLSGSGTPTLVFRYTVVSGDTTADLDYTGTGALALNGGTIRDVASNDAILSLSSPGAAGSLGANKAIVIDTTSAAVTDVTSAKANGTYTVGEVIDVDISFSEPVTVTGTPQLELETGTTDRQVAYLSGSGTSTLTFRYTVAAGDTSSDLDYTGTGALTLNGGTIRDAAANNAVLTLAAPGAAGSLGANKALVIDTTAPTVTNVTSAKSNGTYTIGEVIDVDVSFSETVTVTGTPQLELETGATNRFASYLSGSGTATLTFRYTVTAGDESSDLDYPGSTALTLSGGTIRDAATNNATLTLASPGAAGSLGANKALVVDAVSPTVNNVTSTTPDGAYAAGEAIDVRIVFSEPVDVTGTPKLELELGPTDRTASYVSGSGSSTIVFSYTVAAGDNNADLDYTGTGALSLNGGTIRDPATNNAVLTLAAPGAAGSLGAGKNIVLDTTVPTVTNVTSTKSDGAYATGEVIDVQVVFNELVNVTGTPQLELETGAADRQAGYLSGSGTATLTFRYTVTAGDSSPDLDYTGTGALTLNGGTIRDGVSNDAVLTLPAPGTAGSLGANKALVIDTSPPSAPALALSETEANLHASGTTLWFTGGSGTFTVAATTSDAQSGIGKVAFPAVGSVGAADDTTAPYERTYAWSGAEQLGNGVVAHNGAGLTTSTAFDVREDATAPTGGSISVPAFSSGLTITVTTTSYSDSGSGIASNVITRAQADVTSPGVCGAFAGSTVVTSPDTVPTDGKCYRYTLTGTDNVGNTSSATATVLVDTTPPSAPGLTLSETEANLHASGATLWFRGGAGSGTFTVLASTSDAESGIDKVAFPGVGSVGAADDATFLYERTYAWTGGEELDNDVVAHNRTGLTASTDFDVREDAAAPTGGSISVPSYSSSTTVTLTTASFTDGQSGIASNEITRSDPQDPTGPGVCPAGGWTGATVVSSPDTVPTDGKCYRYTLTGTDNVGNTASTSAVVLVDTTPPSAPALTLSTSSANVHTTGSTVWFKPGTADGAFTVAATTADGESGIDKVAFPAVSSMAGTDDSVTPYEHTYSWTGGAPASAGGNAVTAVNRAAGSSTTTFDLSADATAPTGGAISYPDGPQSDSAPDVNVTLPTDAASGLASVTLQEVFHGSDCSAPGTPTDRGTPSAGANNVILTQGFGCYTFQLVAVDNVGNSQTFTSSDEYQLTGGTSLETVELTSAGSQHLALGNLYLNTAAAADGTFKLRVTAAAELDVQSVDFPAVAFAGLTGAASSDSSAPFESNVYTWTSSFTSSGTIAVTLHLTPAAGGDTRTELIQPLVDTTDPSASDNTGSIGSSWKNSAQTVTLTPADSGSGVGAVNYRLNGGAWSPGTSIALNTSGVYTIDYYAVDNVGNQTDVQTAGTQIRIDLVSPANSFAATSISPAGTAFVNGTDVWYKGGTAGSFSLVDTVSDAHSGPASASFPALATDWTKSAETLTGSAPYTSASFTRTAAATGSFAYVVTGTDAAGNATATTLTFREDSTPPTTGDDYASIGSTWYSTPQTLTLTPDDGAGSGVAATYYSLDGGANYTAGGSVTLSTTGVYNVTFYSVDNVGNAETPQSVGPIRIDATAPVNTVSVVGTIPAGSASLSGTTLFYRGSAPGSLQLRNSLPSGDSGAYGTTFGAVSAPNWTPKAAETVSTPAGGPYTSSAFGWSAGTAAFALTVTGEDNAGNTTDTVLTVTDDSTPPVVSDDTGSITDAWRNTGATVTLTADDATGSGVAEVHYRLNGGAWTPGTSIALSATGVYTIEYYAVDSVGNASAVQTATKQIRIDKLAPSGAITDPASGATVSGSAAQLSATASDAISGVASVQFQVRPAGSLGAFTNAGLPVTTPAYDATWDTTTVTNGDYELRAFVTDLAGNTFGSATRTITVGNAAMLEPPTLTGVVQDGLLKLRWSPSTGGSPVKAYELFVDGTSDRHLGEAQYEEILGPFSQDDTRVFELRAIDASGRVSPLSNAVTSVPSLIGLTVGEARAALAGRGFAVTLADPGALDTDVVVRQSPAAPALATVGTRVDLVTAGGEGHAAFRLQVSSSLRVTLGLHTLNVRVALTEPAQVSARIFSNARLVRTKAGRLVRWETTYKPKPVRAGATIVSFRLPRGLKRTGAYTLLVTARSTTSRTLTQSLTPIAVVRPAVRRITVGQSRIELPVAVGRPSVVKVRLVGTGRLASWRKTWAGRRLQAGTTVLSLPAPRTLRKPGNYRFVLTYRAMATGKVTQTVRPVKVVRGRVERKPVSVVVLMGSEVTPETPIEAEQGVVISPADDADQVFTTTSTPATNVQVIVVDVGGEADLELIRQLRLVYPDLKIVAVVPQGLGAAARDAGATIVMVKPASAELISSVINRLAAP